MQCLTDTQLSRRCKCSICTAKIEKGIFYLRKKTEKTVSWLNHWKKTESPSPIKTERIKYNLTRVCFLLHMVLHHPLDQVHEWRRLWAFAALLVSAMLLPWNEAKCDFSAMFNFGDSNSDTGGFYAAFPAAKGPYGMTHFGRPTGRASDGRLVVDFLGNVTLQWFCGSVGGVMSMYGKWQDY